MNQPTHTTTLSDFLLARIAEDEEMARRCAPYVAGPGAEIQVRLYRTEKMPDGSERGTSETVVPYVPSRALAECEAKRALLTTLSDVEWTGSYAVRDVALGIMAAVYSEHPDYRKEWGA